MKIMIGSDHHGIETRLHLGRLVSALGYDSIDVGSKTSEPVDYPDIAAMIANAVSRQLCDGGILICGTGIGMSIVANKFPGVRAAPVMDVFSVELSRRHNNLNILCLSAEMLSLTSIDEIVKVWLKTDIPVPDSRHTRRLCRISQIEHKQL